MFFHSMQLAWLFEELTDDLATTSLSLLTKCRICATVTNPNSRKFFTTHVDFILPTTNGFAKEDVCVFQSFQVVFKALF
jgi:hypothetical protein